MVLSASAIASRNGINASLRRMPLPHSRSSVRHASNIPKPRVLAKPERFNPPSHPSRLRKPRPSYGAPLSEHERQAQKTRRYPHMMPSEGTFMHWFLTNRVIHIWITMGILVSLTFGVWFEQFVHNTPYADMLPPNSMFFAHPITFVRRYIEVYDMHLAYTSAQVAEKRKQNVEDVKKRSDYRKAHGLDGDTGGLFGGWSAKSDKEEMGPALREGGVVDKISDDLDASPVAIPVNAIEATEQEPLGPNEFVDIHGQRQIAKPWYKFW